MMNVLCGVDVDWSVGWLVGLMLKGTEEVSYRMCMCVRDPPSPPPVIPFRSVALDRSARRIRRRKRVVHSPACQDGFEYVGYTKHHLLRANDDDDKMQDDLRL